LSQTARRFAILANAAAGDKPRSWLAAKIEGAFAFARRRCLVATGGRTGDAGIPREKINQGGTADIHACARPDSAFHKAVQHRCLCMRRPPCRGGKVLDSERTRQLPRGQPSLEQSF
jgi:hypothetical protein